MLMVFPAFYLLIRASGAGWDSVRTSLLRSRTAELLINTAQLTVTVTALSILLGTALAYLVCRGVRTGRSVLIALLTVPLAIPSYVSGFAWGRLIPGFEGFGAAVLILTLACYPLVMLPAIAILSTVGRSAEDVARTLGRRPIAAFVSVVLPVAWQAIAGGALLVALYSISDFGGPAIVRYEVFTVGIYNAYDGAFNHALAAMYGCILMLLAVLLTLAERSLRPVSGPSSATAEPKPAAKASPTAWLLSLATITIAVLVPIAALCREIARSQRVSLTEPGGLATTWDLVRPLALNTLGLGLVAALVIAVVAVPVALFTRRPRTRPAGAVESVLTLGYALPGITVALALVYFSLRMVPQLYLTSALLLIAYLMLFLPVCLNPLRSAMDELPPGREDAARTLGFGYTAAITRVTLPSVTPALLAGAALAGLSVAKELPATLMLAPIGVRTLATDMWSLNNDLQYGQAAVLGLVLIAVASLPTMLLSSRFAATEER